VLRRLLRFLVTRKAVFQQPSRHGDPAARLHDALGLGSLTRGGDPAAAHLPAIRSRQSRQWGASGKPARSNKCPIEPGNTSDRLGTVLNGKEGPADSPASEIRSPSARPPGPARWQILKLSSRKSYQECLKGKNSALQRAEQFGVFAKNHETDVRAGSFEH
jgi:hypothetical protein